jgi:hypothetical protein
MSSRDVIFNEKIMYKDQLQGKKEEKVKLEYTMLDEITANEMPKVSKFTTTGEGGTSNSYKCF